MNKYRYNIKLFWIIHEMKNVSMSAKNFRKFFSTRWSNRKFFRFLGRFRALLTFFLFLFRALHRAWQITSCVSFLKFFDHAVNHRVGKTRFWMIFNFQSWLLVNDYRYTLKLFRIIHEMKNVSILAKKNCEKNSTRWLNRNFYRFSGRLRAVLIFLLFLFRALNRARQITSCVSFF